MISFWRIFWLELVSLIRSRTLAFLLVAAVAWMLGFPKLIRGDGTSDGYRELWLHFSLGGVFALLVISLLASATGSIARERTAKRLQLTLVRPVRFFILPLAKMFAHVAVGAAVLAVATVILALQAELTTPCSHVLTPKLPSPREDAEKMYAHYLKDPDTAAQLRRTDKETAIRVFTQRAMDLYQTIPTNRTVAWRFDTASVFASGRGGAVRMRFTNPMEMRQDVRGVFRLGGCEAVVSNVTQAALAVPVDMGSASCSESAMLEFENRGKSALMIRPRKDLALLVPADAFGWNLLRAYLALVAILAMVVAFGAFLSASLGRPVALFVAMVMLVISEMGPSVVEQYSDEVNASWVDRVGLSVTRAFSSVVSPVSSLSPLGALSRDECVEPSDVRRMLLTDLVCLPLLFSLLAGFVLPRKQND